MNLQHEQKEMAVNSSDVSPGYLYDLKNQKYLPREDGRMIDVRESSYQFKINPMNYNVIRQMCKNTSVKSPWMLDFEKENPKDAILVKGVKICERVGIDTPRHHSMHTVTSVLYKTHADMLLTLSRKLQDERKVELKEYLLAVINQSAGCDLPSEILKISKSLYIYSQIGNTKVKPSKHSFDEFCNILRNKKISTVPMSAYIAEPCLSHVKTAVEAIENSNFLVDDASSNLPESGDGIDELQSNIHESGVASDVGSYPHEYGFTKRDLRSNPHESGVTKSNLRSNPLESGVTRDVGSYPHVSGASKSDLRSHPLESGVTSDIGSYPHESGVTKRVAGSHPLESDVASDLGSCLHESGVTEKDLRSNHQESGITKSDLESNHQQNYLMTYDSDSNQLDAHKKLLRTAQGSNTCNQTNIVKIDETDKNSIGKDQTKVNDTENHMNFSLLPPVKTVNDPCGMERRYYGMINDSYPEKVILFLGAAGCGKTTLINFIANYYMGKTSPDDGLIHVATVSPTSTITAYTFCSSCDESPITIIDTPGLNDSSGAEVRDHVQSLKVFLANASSKGFEIHAIGFVAQAHLVRLTSSERLVMDYVSTTFGQSVSEHLITLITFADNQEIPQVVEAMNNYGVNFKLFLKFNNSSLSSTESDEIDDLDRAYWRVCWKSWRKCLKTLRDLPSLSVKTMKAVQSEVYAATVIESAEKDLFGELTTFLTYCKKENYMSKEASQVCNQVWELAAVIHRLKFSQVSNTPCTLGDILINVALDTCKKLNISPEKYINFLSLNPSGSLITSGVEIILTMVQFYVFAKNGNHLNSEMLSKNITEWSYCQKCCKEHKMERLQFKSGMFSTSDRSVLSLKCQQCYCPGDMHVMSTIESPLHLNKVLQHTRKCLREALTRHLLPGYPVQEETFLQCLNQHLNFKHQDLINDLLGKGTHQVKGH